LVLIISYTGEASDLKVDMSFARGQAVPFQPNKFRINKIKVSFIDPTTRLWKTSTFDVIFEWNTSSFALKPIAAYPVESSSLPPDDTTTGCGYDWKPGDWTYCRNCGPCDEGVGGCDPGFNHQCKGNLICSNDCKCLQP